MLIIPSNQENEKQNIAFNIGINITPDRKVNITKPLKTNVNRHAKWVGESPQDLSFTKKKKLQKT